MKVRWYQLSLMTLTLCMLTVPVHAEMPLLDEEMPDTERRELQEALLRRVIKQMDGIDIALEELSLAIHNNTIKVADKRSLSEHIKTIRNFIADARHEKFFAFTKKNLEMLVEFNKEILAHVHEMLCNNLDTVDSLDKELILNIIKERVAKRGGGAYAVSSMLLGIDSNDTLLSKVVAQHRVAGTSCINRWARSVEKFLGEQGITKVAKRAAPYGLFLAYYIFVNKKEDLHPALQPLKDLLGGAPQRPKGSSGGGTSGGSAGGSSDKKESTSGGSGGGAGGSLDKRDFTADPGILGSPAYYARQILDIDIKPFYVFSAAVYLKPIIEKDAKDFYGWLSEKYKELSSKVKGEPYEDPSPLKKSKLTFKDVIGYEHTKAQLESIIGYFKAKEIADRSGTFSDRGYLFVGPLDVGRELAYALAGEITKELENQELTKCCKVYELHASALLKKNIKDTLTEIENGSPYEPAILLLNDLNWLTTNAGGDAELWGSLVTTMSSALKGNRKQIFVIATTQSIAPIDAALKGQGRLGHLIQFGQPNFANRKAYFERELSKRSGVLAKFDLEKLARETQDCSYDVLAGVIKKGYALAQQKERSLTQEDLDASITTLVHGVQSHNQQQTMEQKQALATFFAAKALALEHFSTQKRLLKVTILPVSKGDAGITHGACYTFTHETDALYKTRADIINDAVVALSGIEAQKLLNNGVVTQSLAHEAKQEAFGAIKKMMLEGIEEKQLSKKVRDEKTDAAWQEVERCAQQAASFVAQQAQTIERIKQALLAKGLLTQQEVQALC